ncbi:prephenate dehydratase domain-containing protein [Pseudomonas sp. MWU13-3659]|uniref:prephenate dehydratase n=1 Tax=Pseudomonas sp. MWU13-3659 TaxID=2986964 RepID=UPI0020758875|nr:prephenate dehydratase domain-containing protein [Pseudomonas sp. MWU13-3659]
MKKSLASALLACTLAASTQAMADKQTIAYLGPAGSWTHQASIDLYGTDQNLLGMTREQWIEAYDQQKVDKLVVPIANAAVGLTHYLDDVLALKQPLIVAEYPKMLSYDLMAKPGATFAQITRVLAHPVALTEVKPWLDTQMPGVERVDVASAGEAARQVAEGSADDVAAMGPHMATEVYGLVSLRDGIEKGPHNVTRWWVMGYTPAKPTGDDKTTLLVEVNDAGFNNVLKSLVESDIRVLDIYERPNLKTLDGHKYVIDVVGHAEVGQLKAYLHDHRNVRLLGSYPRRY